MKWNDLREFLDRLEEMGDLQKVDGADWNVEIGAITEVMVERGGPALLFDNIPGYAKGFRIASNINRTPRHVAVTLGLKHDAPIEEMAEEWEKTLPLIEPVPTERVPTGPIFENTITGEDIDLLKFPVPNWHEKDGNRYIGTGVCVIQQDPDTGFVNAGTYRVAVHDKATCGIFIEPDKHGDVIRRKFWSRGKRCPVVVVVGQEPILAMMAGSHMYRAAYGTSELEIAGYLQGDGVPVVQGPVTGLPIPATAEIVIEGFIPSPEERLEPEGPFGEWTGYYAHERRPETVIEVAAIYHRNDPIIYGSPPVRPIRTYKDVGNVDLRTKNRLKRAGIAGVAGVFGIARPNLSVVAVQQQYAGHVEDLVRVLEPGGEQHTGHRMWVLVDDDIDPSNTEEVLWAIASRCIPQTAVTIVPVNAVWQLDPRIPPGGRSDPTAQGRTAYRADCMIINACRPWAWKDDFPPVNRNSPELTAAVEEKWKHLFAGLPTL